MKNLFYKAFLFLAFAALITSCKPEETTNTSIPSELTIELVMKDSNGNTVNTGENITLSNGYEMNISLFRLYLSNFYLNSSSNKSNEIKDVVLLSPGISGETSFTVQVADDTFSKLTFGLGLDPADNDKNPDDFENTHPLSTYQSMYWSMLKYRFVKFEAKINQAGQLGTASDISSAFHPGTDPLYQEVELPLNLTTYNGSKTTLTLEINIDDLFIGANSFDFSNPSEFSSHSGTSDIQYAEKFMKNLKSSISLKTP